MTADPSQQIEALSSAVTTTDKARRVGWARAYSAEESREQLSRDLNIARSERDIMRRALSFLFGFMQIYAHQEAVGMLGERIRSMEAILDPEATAAGRAVGELAAAADVERAQRAAERAKEQKTRRNAHNRDFKAAREQERRKLMERYGFPNEAALFNYLELYAAYSDREEK